MSNDGIFLIRDNQLVVLSQKLYDSEDLLQEALARFPEVLAGSSTTDGSPRPLILVKREMGVPKAEGAGSTWSLDHLFVDGDAVPVVVECKRSSNTEVRRQVIGQMLDYAANGVRYWPPADLRTAVAARAAEKGLSGEDLLRQLLPEVEPDEFWARVAENLRSGHIRMVFVADHLPPELVRVIEFLNEQMSPAEVLGVEVPQFVGEGHQVLVPRVVGRTASAVAAKQVASGQSGSDSPGIDQFRAAVAATTPGQQAFLTPLCEWASELESRQLARLTTHRGTSGVILRVYLPSDMSLVTVNCAETASLQLFGSVFSRRAPSSQARLAELIGAAVGQGTAVRQLVPGLLELLTGAYEEAALPLQGP